MLAVCLSGSHRLKPSGEQDPQVGQQQHFQCCILMKSIPNALLGTKYQRNLATAAFQTSKLDCHVLDEAGKAIDSPANVLTCNSLRLCNHASRRHPGVPYGLYK
jgi:hypothetical protein